MAQVFHSPLENREEVEMKLGFRGIVFSLFVGILAACVKPTTPTPPTSTPEPGPSQVWITAPASGAILPLAPVDIKFEGTSFVGITEFEIRINGGGEALVPPSSSGSCGSGCGMKFFGEYLWTPPGTGVYTIGLRALGNGKYSPSTEIEVTIENVVSDEAEPPPLKPTPTPTAVPQIKPEKVTVVGLKNGNCREGGGNQYNEVDALMKDQTAEAIARSEDDLYVKIIGPNWKIECWVWIDLVKVEEGDVKLLPVESFPTAPEPAEPQPEPGQPKPAPTATPVGKP